ncbi:hypothetical protein J2Z66_004673 [Paenibacillus eucommiae]|uniref:Uncharacterized protein n=1 Tax=Paenibacillus eucommiae TaxID=1355755 RepID=A0ABS4J1Q0_9BACL|nr:hypothetical protein [Paenibacillus eucommiae]
MMNYARITTLNTVLGLNTEQLDYIYDSESNSKCKGNDEMRLGENFLNNRSLSLCDYGYEPDPGCIEHTDNGNIVFYHYTREDRLEQIFSLNSGLFARLPVDVCPNPPNEFIGCFMVEGLLEPLPTWLTNCPYFGDLGIEMMRRYVGNVLLRIEVPSTYEGLFTADYAHIMEAKHLEFKGSSPLNLGYDCSTGKEVTQAYVNSYVSADKYKNRHIAPVMQAARKEQGIVIPRDYISVALKQPLK